MQHCCRYIDIYLSDPPTNIDYSSIFREYYIRESKGIIHRQLSMVPTKQHY